MSEIFNEIDDELRKEQLKKIWDKYSIYIFALAVLIVAGVGGWRACARRLADPGGGCSGRAYGVDGCADDAASGRSGWPAASV